jgi:nucleoid-associated protein YgaU
MEDLTGKSIGVLQGDPDVKAYVTKAFPGARVVELSDASINGARSWIAYQIGAHAVDAVVYDYPFAVAEIAGTNLQFAIAKLPGSDIKYKIAVRESDTQLLGAINQAISVVKEDPRYLDLLKQYFTSTNLAKARDAGGSESVYTVRPGDTLSTIAAAKLGNMARFPELETRNNLPNPNFIVVGQKLVIPRG